jgi:protein-tyrosine phosphatase
MKVLMVCLGNICRSPMAEGLLRNKAEERNLPVEVDSAGTGDWHVGEQPDHRAIKFMKNKGIDISGLRARQFKPQDFKNFDLILTMDKENYANVLALAHTDEDRDKTKMILNYSKPDTYEPVPDPYFGGDEGFELVYNLLDEAIDHLLQNVDSTK